MDGQILSGTLSNSYSLALQIFLNESGMLKFCMSNISFTSTKSEISSLVIWISPYAFDFKTRGTTLNILNLLSASKT